MTLPVSLKKAVDEAIDKLHSPDGSIVLLSGEVDDLKSSVYDVVASFLEAARKKLKEDMQKLKSSWEENCVGEEDSGDLPDLEAFAHDLVEFINKYEHSAVFGGEK